ncbi:hypothetical protein AMJ57_01535 [Parcubacteria bacterium SG8_24]|nr:MAG: hypothetical protein AMJ57_01535 [Parcubacteria bacterium SG8_24]
MRPDRSRPKATALIYVLMIALVVLWLVSVLLIPSVAPAAGKQLRPTEVRTMVLEPDRKLVDVAWRCHPERTRCDLWTLTRPMRPGEPAETLIFSNGPQSYIIAERSGDTP